METLRGEHAWRRGHCPRQGQTPLLHVATDLAGRHLASLVGVRSARRREHPHRCREDPRHPQDLPTHFKMVSSFPGRSEA